VQLVVGDVGDQVVVVSDVWSEPGEQQVLDAEDLFFLERFAGELRACLEETRILLFRSAAAQAWPTFVSEFL
jgi:hypothetical protein